MHIVFDSVEQRARALIEKALAGHTLTFLDTALTKDHVLPADTEILSVFVSSSVTRAHMEQAPNLTHISTRSMGYDHIDCAAAKERGISVSYVPAYGAYTVAEFAFALLLGLSRKAYPAYMRLKGEGSVDAAASEGFDLHGKVFGVVGTGKIGKNAARIGKAFGMQIVLYDVMQDAQFAQDIGATYLPLEALVAQADIVSIHVPLLPTTEHLFNAALFAACKPDLVLINTSRGGVVDTIALRDALTSGHIGAAGLDVFEGEREIFGADKGKAALSPEAQAAHDIIERPNVLITPHIAYDTVEAKLEIVTTALEGIMAFIAGTPKNTVAL